MKQYADFCYYLNNFHGTVIEDESAFDRMAVEASFYLNEITLGRADAADATSVDELKMATCAVAEIVHEEYMQKDEDQVSSETVGPHSVSYVKKIKTADEFEKEKLKIAKRYLFGTGLIYRGISS